MGKSRTKVSHVQFADDTIFFLKLVMEIFKISS